MSESTERLAAAFFAAIERGDLAAVRELYAPDVRVWHNVTGRTQTRDENLRLLAFFASRVADRRYEVLARDHFPGGFVQRHVLHGKLASGEAVEAPVCLVVYAADLRPFVRVLEQHGVRDDADLPLITEGEHLHSTDPRHRKEFERLCQILGVGEGVERVSW